MGICREHCPGFAGFDGSAVAAAIAVVPVAVAALAVAAFIAEYAILLAVCAAVTMAGTAGLVVFLRRHMLVVAPGRPVRAAVAAPIRAPAIAAVRPAAIEPARQIPVLEATAVFGYDEMQAIWRMSRES